LLTATLFGYDEFILREVSPETFLAASSARRQSARVELPELPAQRPSITSI
jgi:hypothetical protein